MQIGHLLICFISFHDTLFSTPLQIFKNLNTLKSPMY